MVGLARISTVGLNRLITFIFQFLIHNSINDLRKKVKDN
jgi:hypothetical protein